MSVPFERSETRQNLMRAFAGECQARTRYTFAAGLAKSRELPVIQSLFLFTAEQEKEHAERYYGFLRPFCGENLRVEADYPVSLFSDVGESLRDARHNEEQEWEREYRAFARVAREEGFSEIAEVFSRTAEVERTHADRFGRYADLLEQGQLFTADRPVLWVCLNCGHVVEAASAPALCPLCAHGQGYFIRREDAPFGG